MKVLGLARVSTAEQAGDNGEGLARQRRTIEGIARKHGLPLVGIIEIIDVSGSDVASSPEWQGKVVPAIAAADVHLAVDSVDRLSRAVNFASFKALSDLAESKTRIYLPTAVKDMSDQDDFAWVVSKAMSAGSERTEIKRRTWNGKEEMRRDGKWVSNPDRVPLGFAYSKKTGTWSTTADIARVQRAYESLVSGTPIASVAAELGYADGNTRKILKNTIYRGVLTWDKRVVDPADKKMVARDPSEVISVRILAEDEQPVSDALWQAAQARLEQIRGRRLGRKSEAQATCWATGHLADASTILDGNSINPRPVRLFGHLHDQGHWRYQTSTAEWSLHADRLHHCLDRYLSAVTEQSSFLRAVEQAARKHQAEAQDIDREGIEREIATLAKQQKKANAKFDVDAITLADLKSETARIKKAVAALEARLAAPRPEPTATPEAVVEAARQMASFPVGGTAEAKRAWMARYQVTVYLHADRMGTVCLTIPCLPKPFVLWTGVVREQRSFATLLEGFRPAYRQGHRTTTEVAGLLGLNPSTMRKYILRGRVPAPPSIIGGDGRRWTDADVDAARAALAL